MKEIALFLVLASVNCWLIDLHGFRRSLPRSKQSMHQQPTVIPKLLIRRNSSRSEGETAAISTAAAAKPLKPSFPTTFSEGDVVEYRITEKEKKQLAAQGIRDERVMGSIMQRRKESTEHFIDEDLDAIDDPPEKVVIRIAWFSQRIIEDRKINPHGEEAEDVFIIKEELTTEKSGPVCRY